MAKHQFACLRCLPSFDPAEGIDRQFYFKGLKTMCHEFHLLSLQTRNDVQNLNSRELSIWLGNSAYRLAVLH